MATLQEKLSQLTPEERQSFYASKTPEQLQQLKQQLAAESSGELQVANERTPYISGMERFKVKNFGTTEAALTKLRQDHPELDINLQGNEIIAKKKNETVYKKLDPSGMELADISDALYDIGSGIATGVGTVAAGLPTAGWGAVPVGAATGAGLEGLRQSIGKYLGYADIKPSEIATSGAIGGVLPAGLATIGSTYKAGRGVAKGLLKRVSGASDEVLDNYLQNINKFSGGKEAPFNPTQAAQETSDYVQGILKAKEAEAAIPYQNAKDVLVDPTPVLEEVSKAEQDFLKRNYTGKTAEFRNKLKNILEPIMPKSTGIVDEYGNEIMGEVPLVTHDTLNLIKNDVENLIKDTAVGTAAVERRAFRNIENAIIQEPEKMALEAANPNMTRDEIARQYRLLQDKPTELLKKVFENKYSTQSLSKPLATRESEAFNPIFGAMQEKLSPEELRTLQKRLVDIETAKTFSTAPEYSIPTSDLRRGIESMAMGTAYGLGTNAAGALASKNIASGLGSQFGRKAIEKGSKWGLGLNKALTSKEVELAAYADQLALQKLIEANRQK